MLFSDTSNIYYEPFTAQCEAGYKRELDIDQQQSFYNSLLLNPENESLIDILKFYILPEFQCYFDDDQFTKHLFRETALI